MTSRPMPDYYIDLVIDLEAFNQLSGQDIDVSISYGKPKKRIRGTLIIPQGNAFPEYSETCTAWLWPNKRIDLPPGIEVDFRIIHHGNCSLGKSI